MNSRRLERIHEARRMGLRNRMRDDWGMPETAAGALLDAWEREAVARGLTRSDPAWWATGEAWMEEQRPRRH